MHQPFLVMASESPVGGAFTLPPPLLNRLHVSYFDEYSHSELIELAKDIAHVSNTQADKMVQALTRANKKLGFATSPFAFFAAYAKPREEQKLSEVAVPSIVPSVTAVDKKVAVSLPDETSKIFCQIEESIGIINRKSPKPTRHEISEAQLIVKQNILKAFENSFIQSPEHYSADINYNIASILNGELKLKPSEADEEMLQTAVAHLVYNATNPSFEEDDQERSIKLLFRIHADFFPKDTLLCRLKQYITTTKESIDGGEIYGGIGGKIFGSYSIAVPLKEKYIAANNIFAMYFQYLTDNSEGTKSLSQYIKSGRGSRACGSGALKNIVDDLLQKIPPKGEQDKETCSIELKTF